MLAEFLKLLTNHIRQSDEVKFVRVPGESESYMCVRGDSVVPVDREPLRTHASADGLDAIAAMAMSEASENPEIYVNETGVQLLLDAEDRREQVIYHTNRSNQLVYAYSNSEEWMSCRVAELWRILTFEVRCKESLAMATKIESLDFQRLNNESERVGHGRESLGKSIEAKVQQADSIQNVEWFNIPAFSNIDLGSVIVPVEMHLELLPAEGRIRWRFTNSSIKRAMGNASIQMVKLLEDLLEVHGGEAMKPGSTTGIPIYRGRDHSHGWN